MEKKDVIRKLNKSGIYEMDTLVDCDDFLEVVNMETGEVETFWLTSFSSDLIEGDIEDIDVPAMIEGLNKILENLPHMVSNINKIVFINSEETLEHYNEQYGRDYDLESLELGKLFGIEKTILINLPLIAEGVNDMYLANHIETEMSNQIWITVLHEMAHIYQSSPFYIEVYSGLNEESEAEAIGIDLFDNFIDGNDTIIKMRQVA